MYFKETLQIELAMSRLAQENEDLLYIDDVNREVSATLINLCSLYCSMGRYETSLNYGKQSNLILLEIVRRYS